MDKNIYTYREFRTRTLMHSQIPLFRNTLITETPKYLHHCSLYGITENDARLQSRLGNTKYREVQHYSSELVIDTDNLETANRLYDVLIERDYSFELWKLNNYKFYLQRSETDKPSTTMCYQDRQFVRNEFYACNVEHGLDLGIYSSPFHLCRAKGAIHEVTGKKSILEAKIEGSRVIDTSNIELKYIEKPSNTFNYDPNVSDWSQLQNVFALAQGMQSNKHNCLYGLGKELKHFLTYSTGCEIACIYANSLNYDTDKALRGFTQGYSS